MINGFNLRTPVRGQKGFTLVEVIVVAIIVAALAAVAIPLYTSYVSSSRKNATANTAGSIASFCGACRNAAGIGAIKDLHTPAGGGSFRCEGASDTTSIQIPADIRVTNYTAPTATTPGSITAAHTSDSTATATYSF